ncbi:MAG: hypothetical protein IT372_21510 [Polyangiaceae bacterium]|nr:hypothetical protein [Polyangiaceae bacterium]
MIRRRPLLAAAFAAALLAAAWPGLAGEEQPAAPLPSLPLDIAVAEVDGAPAQDAAWIDAQIAEAARLFGGLGAPVARASSRTLGARFAAIETREDRDALAAHLTPGKINVMIVGSLRDVDDPELFRMGVHWRNRKAPSKRYVIVSASARPSTLAHELGHYFGLGHSRVKDNVMSYDRSGAAVFFDASQAATIRAHARMYLASKLLVPPAGDLAAGE